MVVLVKSITHPHVARSHTPRRDLNHGCAVVIRILLAYGVDMRLSKLVIALLTSINGFRV